MRSVIEVTFSTFFSNDVLTWICETKCLASKYVRLIYNLFFVIDSDLLHAILIFLIDIKHTKSIKKHNNGFGFFLIFYLHTIWPICNYALCIMCVCSV